MRSAIAALLRPEDPSPRRIAAIRIASIAVFGVLPAFMILTPVVDVMAGNAAWAFRDAFLGAAEAVVRGDSPYPALEDPALERGTAYVYPPLMALLVVPFTWLSANAAAGAFALILVAAVPATLWVAGVRDWRCYGLALLWPPVLSAVHGENISLLMALAAALVWRFRDRPLVAGAALGASIAVKPLLWPLGVWLLVSRRLAAVVWSAAVALVLLVGSWAVIGFAGLRDYPDLVRHLSGLMDEWGYTVYALALDAGAETGPARVLGTLLAAALFAACVVLARRGDDRRAFVLATAAVIASSPIVWLHYFVLLLVVVSVAQPRLGLVWFVPLVMFGSEEVANGTAFQTALALVAAALTIGVALRGSPSVPRQVLVAAPATGRPG